MPWQSEKCGALDRLERENAGLWSGLERENAGLWSGLEREIAGLWSGFERENFENDVLRSGKNSKVVMLRSGFLCYL